MGARDATRFPILAGSCARVSLGEPSFFFQVCTELRRRQRNLQSTPSVVLFSLLLCGQVHVEISIQPIWPLIDLRLSAFVWTIKRRDGKEGTAKTFIDHTMLHALIVKRQVARYYVDVVYPNMV